MSRLDEDEALLPDERLRTALRHAPDAQREPPAAVTAHILATARAASARQTAAVPARAKRPRGIGLGSWTLARPGLAFGLAALLGVAAVWWLQHPRDEAPTPVDLRSPRMARLPDAPQVEAPVTVARAEAPAAAAVAKAPEESRVALARQPAPRAPARAEVQAAVPEIVVMSQTPPPAVAAPVAAAAPTAVARERAPAVVAAASHPEPQSSGNPLRAWLAGLPEAASAQHAWLLAVAEATEGRWQDQLPPPPVPVGNPKFAAAPPEGRRIANAVAASVAQPGSAPARSLADSWLLSESGGRRVSLRLWQQGLLWCEAGHCRYAPIEPAVLRELRHLREPAPLQPSPREP